MSENIHFRGGAAFLTSSKAAVVIKTATGEVYGADKKGQFITPEKYDNDRSVKWAKWGANNDMPNKTYAQYLENSGVLSAGIDIVSRIAMGRTCIPVNVKSIGINGEEELSPIDDDEILGWLEDNNINTFAYETILDAVKTGHSFSSLLSNKAGDKINRLKRTDASICRLEKFDSNGSINNVYMSYEWGTSRARAFDKKYIKSVKLLDRNSPIRDLQNDAGNFNKLPSEFMVTSNYPLFSRQYYAMPHWYTVRAWLDIVMGVPEMKATMFNNQMTIKYFIEIDNAYWVNRWQKWGTYSEAKQEDLRKKVFEELDQYLAGNKNAYKSLFTGTRTNPVNGDSIPFLRVTALDDKIKDGKLLPDSAAGDSQILFALMLNPSLLGVDMPGGLYGGGKGGSNIREAFMVQILIREVERAFVIKPLMLAAKVNGWKATYPRLGFRFPNHYLTTLDTGKNAKPIM